MNKKRTWGDELSKNSESPQFKKQKMVATDRYTYSWLMNSATRLIHCLENPKIMESSDINMQEFATKVRSLLLNSKKELGYALHTEIILAGKVGVGKSTIINSLLGYNIAPSGNNARSLTRAIVKYKYWENSTFLVKTFREQKTKTTNSIDTSDFIESKVIGTAKEVNTFLRNIFKNEEQRLLKQPILSDDKEDEVQNGVQMEETSEKIQCVEVYCKAELLSSGLISLIDAPGYSYGPDSNFMDTTYRMNSVNCVEYWVVFDGVREQEDPTLWNFIRKVFSGMEALQTNSICLVWHRFRNVLSQMVQDARDENNEPIVTDALLADFKRIAKKQKLEDSNKYLSEEYQSATQNNNNNQEANANFTIYLKEENLMCSYVDNDAISQKSDIYIEELKERIKFLEKRSQNIFANLVDNLCQLINTSQQSNFISVADQLSHIFNSFISARNELQPKFTETSQTIQSSLVSSKGYSNLRAAINGGGFFQNARIRINLQQEVIEMYANSVQRYFDPILKQVYDCISAESELQPFKNVFENIIRTKTRLMVEHLKSLVHSCLPPNIVQRCAFDSSGNKIKRERGFSQKIFLKFMDLVRPISNILLGQLLEIFKEMQVEIDSQLRSYSKGLNVKELRKAPAFAEVESLLNSIKNHELEYKERTIPREFKKLSCETGGRCFAESMLFCLNEQARTELYNYIVEYCDVRLQHSRTHNQQETSQSTVSSLSNASLYEILLMFDCYVFPTELGLNKMCLNQGIKLEIIGDLLGDDTYRYFGEKHCTTKIVLYYDAVLCKFYPLSCSGNPLPQIDNSSEFTIHVSHTEELKQ